MPKYRKASICAHYVVLSNVSAVLPEGKESVRDKETRLLLSLQLCSKTELGN
jgi:hypothetical protein